MSAIISVSNLSKTYGSGFKALNLVNLEIRRGEIFALLGPNGAGKTTLFQLLAGLFIPDAGRIYKLSLEGKVLGMLGQSGKQLKQFGWIHAMACPSENVIYVAELLNWRVQKLLLKP